MESFLARGKTFIREGAGCRPESVFCTAGAGLVYVLGGGVTQASQTMGLG